MRAKGRFAILAAPESWRVASQPRPVFGVGDVLVRLEGCGVCGSNLPVWEGRPWFNYPFAAGAPGHEGWGVVEAVGGEVDRLRVGDRVALLSYHAFAEFDVAPADRVVPLPAALEKQAFPGEALGCAMNIFRRSDIGPGQTVAIVGVGFIGALLTNLAARAGARVIGISRRTYALEMACRMGAAETVSARGLEEMIGAVKEITGSRGADRVIEATGEQASLDLAAELCAERGRLVIAGYHQDGRRTVNMQLWNWRGLDVINAHERAPHTYVEGMRLAAEAVAAGRLDPSPLYTHRFTLDELPDAFCAMRARPEGFLKGLVSYT
jgi:threonine dehydrogenase-like Zn-dependent dehydrogenase